MVTSENTGNSINLPLFYSTGLIYFKMRQQVFFSSIFMYLSSLLIKEKNNGGLFVNTSETEPTNVAMR